MGVDCNVLISYLALGEGVHLIFHAHHFFVLLLNTFLQYLFLLLYDIAVHCDIFLHFFQVVHLTNCAFSFFSKNLVLLLLPIHFFYFFIFGCQLLLESLAHLSHISIVLQLQLIDFVLVLLFQFVHLLFMFRS